MDLSFANSVIRRLTAVAGLVILSIGASAPAMAVEKIISAGTDNFDCSSVRPGDVLTLASGIRGPLTIHHCKGTAASPIIIRNNPDGSAPTELRKSGGSGSFVLSCNWCVGVEIDGSYKWRGAPTGKTYGIKVTATGGSGPSAFVRIGGLSSFVTIRNLEIDGAWPRITKNGSGIRINDHDVKRSKYPGAWREKILIEDNYIHDIPLSGTYIGPNYGDGDIPLRDVVVRYNRVEDTGLDGIQTKSMWSGNNLVHHNIVRRAGKSTSFTGDDSQYSGIKNIGGTVKIYNNWVESTGQHGIISWTQQGPKISEGKGPFVAQIWNNVIVDAGALWRPFMLKAYGIRVGAQAGCEKPVPSIYNNTIVNASQGAIALAANVGSGFVRDNIIAGAAGNPVIVSPSYVKLINNEIGSVTRMAFVDAARENFRLTVNSPARNQGSNDFPATDFDDVSRPKDGAPDLGAFEGAGPN